MVKFNVYNIIILCCIWGDTTQLPIIENTELNPISPYGTTKKICEEIIMNYSKTKTLNL